MNNTTNQTISQYLSNWASSTFQQQFTGCGHDFSDICVVATANEEHGDYQCNAAMGLAKVLHQAPRKIAEAIVEHAELPAAIERIEVAGPGFINLFLNAEWLASSTMLLAGDALLGIPQVGTGKTIVMDYGSPNITKPLHIGHLRSHNIGSALDRLYRSLGYKVVADNHLGDWGTQFGLTIQGYREFGNEEKMRTEPLEELERVYVRSYERSRQDEGWLNQCRAELVKLQSGDPENKALWEMFVRHSMDELDRIYARLGISYDIVRGESHYHDKLLPTVELLEEKGLAVQSEGATVVNLEDEGLRVCIVRKSDGGFNYTTSDVATAGSRISEFSPERIVYVTDERQQLHFKQVFSICRKLGYTTRMDHVWFGLMRLPDATFSTREGNVIKLETLLDKAEEMALEIVRTSASDMDPEQQKKVARAVGIGAVKYSDLSQNPQSLVTFRVEKAFALDGNSGPYLQYAYARIAGVRRKYEDQYPDRDPNDYPLQITEPIERTLAVKLLRFADTVKLAADGYKPSVVADYLYDLAQTYSTFYQNVPFLKADEGVRESRVRLCGLVAQVLGKGLELLGIEVLERI